MKGVLVRWVMVACGILVSGAGCASTGRQGGEDGSMKYVVKRAAGPMTIDGNWDKPAWQAVEAIELARYMGERPTHFPKVRAKVMYDDDNLYVIFRVEDRYVRAVAKQHQDSVCRDSCVEFFFVPGIDTTKGYFNLEMNCGGTMLFHFQVVPRKGQVLIPPQELARIEVAPSMPRIVEPELPDPTTWTVEYRLPTDFLTKYCLSAQRPAPGVIWRANFYKCADESSHPHWLTWSEVKRPRPDFHVPEFFGTLVFE